MLTVTFHKPGEVRLAEKPDPEPIEADDAVVAIESSGVCGSDMHIFHGRHPVEDGFTIGHEFVGRVTAAGDDVKVAGVGDRVVGCFLTSCGHCFFCDRRLFHKCDNLRIFGHGEISGGLQGAQAEKILVPRANLGLLRVPDGVSDDAALFAGDVMATGVDAIRSARVAKDDIVGVIGLGPVGLCAVQAAVAAGASQVIAIDSIPARLELARSFGATPVHLEEEDPRAAVKAATEQRGVDVCVEAVGHPQVLDSAIRLTRKAGTVAAVGVHGKPCEVHMGLVWNKSITIVSGLANVIAQAPETLDLIADGKLDPGPIVSHHMPLHEAVEAYSMYDRREALKIVLRP